MQILHDYKIFNHPCAFSILLISLLSVTVFGAPYDPVDPRNDDHPMITFLLHEDHHTRLSSLDLVLAIGRQFQDNQIVFNDLNDHQNFSELSDIFGAPSVLPGEGHAGLLEQFLRGRPGLIAFLSGSEFAMPTLEGPLLRKISDIIRTGKFITPYQRVYDITKFSFIIEVRTESEIAPGRTVDSLLPYAAMGQLGDARTASFSRADLLPFMTTSPFVCPVFRTQQQEMVTK